MAIGVFRSGLPFNTESLATSPIQFQDPTALSEDVVDVSDIIKYLDPDVTPFTTIITQNARKEAVQNWQWHWYVQDILAYRQNTIDASFVENAGPPFQTTIPLADADVAPSFRKGSLVRNERTGELMKVTAFNPGSPPTIDVIRGYGHDATAATGTTEKAATAGDSLTIIGDVNEQGARAPDAIHQRPVNFFNYTSILRERYGVPGSVAATQFRWGNELTRLDFEALYRHKLKIEETLMRSERNRKAGPSGKLETMTGGLEWWLDPDNGFVKTGFGFFDFSGVAISEDLLERDILPDAFRYGRKRKVAFVSRRLMGAISLLANKRIQIVRDQSTFGIKVTKYMSGSGDLDIIPHDLLPEDKSNNVGEMWIIDTESIRYRFMAGNGISRDTHLRRNIQLPDSDSIEHEYLTEMGLQIDNPERHARIKVKWA